MSTKLDVIIPTFNRAGTLRRAIDSVIQQTYTDWQLWIVDDGSTDSTAQLLAQYDLPQMHILTTENRGVSAARNLALQKSSHDLVAFLDSDDEWLPEKLQKQVDYLEQNPTTPLVHGEEIWIRNGVRVNPMKKHKKSGGDVFLNSLKLCCISPSTVLMRKKLFSQVGFFREDFPVCEDYDLWLKITSQFSVGFIKDPLIKKYGGHEDQLSRRLKAMDYWRVKSIGDLLDTGRLSEDQKREAEKELIKKAQVLLGGYRKHENLGRYDEVFKRHLR